MPRLQYRILQDLTLATVIDCFIKKSDHLRNQLTGAYGNHVKHAELSLVKSTLTELFF